MAIIFRILTNSVTNSNHFHINSFNYTECSRIICHMAKISLRWKTLPSKITFNRKSYKFTLHKAVPKLNGINSNSKNRNIAIRDLYRNKCKISDKIFVQNYAQKTYRSMSFNEVEKMALSSIQQKLSQSTIFKFHWISIKKKLLWRVINFSSYFFFCVTKNKFSRTIRHTFFKQTFAYDAAQYRLFRKMNGNPRVSNWPIEVYILVYERSILIYFHSHFGFNEK